MMAELRHGENSMQAERIGATYGVSGPDPRSSLDTVLLIGGENAFKSDIANRMLCGFQVRIAGHVTTLLEGLSLLESKAIDVVLLSSEFREEELSLFAFDAQRRGFGGLILHIASLPDATAGSAASRWSRPLPAARLEAQESALRPSRELPSVAAKAMDPQRRPEWNELHGSVSFTPRQQEVLTRVSEGWTNQQIAHHLMCSEGSVKAVIQELFKKLGVRKRTHIVRMVFERTF
jgi:DNA-binding CsgD family transcriptional regulator